MPICRFAPVVLLTVAVFTRATAQDMPLSELLIEGESWKLVDEGFKFTEGPAVDAAGDIFFTDVPESRVYRLSGNGKASIFLSDSERTNGLMFGADGRLYGCQNGKEQIVAFEKEGKTTVLATDVESNDLVVTREGNIYFTDPANKQVWLLTAKGEKRVVDKGIERPNGIILWPDQKTLVVADTAGESLWTFRIAADGSLTAKQPYYTAQVLPGRKGSGADGMSVDSRGRLYAATYAGLQVFDTQGRLSGVIAKPQEKFLSNVCFGGPDLGTLYVTCSDKVYRRKVKATGVRYFDPPKK